jgi:integrase
MLRQWRPPVWETRRPRRTTAAPFFGCQIWIIPRQPSSTASPHPVRGASTSSPSSSSLHGTVPNLGSPSTASWWFAIACTWKDEVWAANTINQQLAAVRRLAYEAADAGLLSPELAAGISRVKGVKQLGFRSGNWLSVDQSTAVLNHASGDSPRARRDYAMLAMLLGCGLCRSELVGLEMRDVQTRQGHWAIVDLIGKGRRVRTVPIPQWTKQALDRWVTAAGITEGKIFRAASKRGKVWGQGISQNVVWYVVRECCKGAGLENIASHDLRRTCAKLCHSGGGEPRADSVLVGPRVGADDGTLSRLQTKPRAPAERSFCPRNARSNDCPRA